MTTIKGILCWGLAVFLAAPVWGQEIGDRVRIKVKGRKSYLVGYLTAIDEQKFIFQMSDGRKNTVPRTQIIQMSRRVGTKTYWKLGAIIGGAMGAFIGMFAQLVGEGIGCDFANAIALTTRGEDSECTVGPPIEGAIMGAVRLVLPGAFGGWIIKTDKWEVIKLGEEAQVGIAPVFRLATREGNVRPTIGLSMQFQKR